MLPGCTLGSDNAALGAMVLAAPPQSAQSVVQWRGPFAPGEAMFLHRIQWQDVIYGEQVSLNPDQIAALLRSDPAWWQVIG